MVPASILPKVAADAKDPTPRAAQWLYATFHTVTATVGAGVLSLPYAMAQLGWGPGTLAFILFWCLTLYTIWQLTELHECVPDKRFGRYRELGQHAFGPRLGLWVVMPPQLIVQVGCDVVYMVTGGQCLQQFAEIAFPKVARLRESYWICIFGSVQFFLSQFPNLSSISVVSFAAAVMSLSYSTLSWLACLGRGPIADVSYAYKKTTPSDSMFRAFNALGQVAFAYAGHGVILEVQATIPSFPSKPSKGIMWKGTVFSYFITAICYFPVATIGYWTFGRDVDENVLVALKQPQWVIAAANLMVVVHVVGSYQVYAMPVFDTIESILTTRLGIPHGIALRLGARSIYVALTLFAGVTFPFFADLLGFFGGFGFTPVSLIIPGIVWLKIIRPKRFTLSWILNWGSIFLGVFIMVASTIGGLRNIIKDSSTFKFYS